MEDDCFPVSSQLGFSDEGKDDHVASPSKRPKKRPCTACFSLENNRPALPEHQDSPTLSKASFYTRGLESNNALPPPVFLPITNHSNVSLAEAVPSDGSLSLPSRATHARQRSPPSTSRRASVEPISRDGAVLNPSQGQRIATLPKSSVLDPTMGMCAPFADHNNVCRKGDTMFLGAQEIPEIPSPPVFSSDEDDQIKNEEKLITTSANQLRKTRMEHAHQKDTRNAKKGNSSHVIMAKHENRNQTQLIVDTGNPPEDSKNSSYFSFSRVLVEQELKTESKEKNLDEQTEHPIKPNKRYYMRAFDYVVTQVLSRYRLVLSEHDVKTVNLIKLGITHNAQALFIRVYRRKQPQWYRTSGLEESYRTEFDVSAAIEELCEKNIMISSKYAAEGSETGALVLARDLISTCSLDEVRQLCGSLIDGKKLRKLPKSKLLPTLKNILLESFSKKTRKRKLRQTTLTGATPSQNLARAVLRTAGHSIRIPEHILTSLEKVHFLFFLEDGHDSPNVILADTGKAKFPSYICDSRAMIFPSRTAYENYRTALALEQELDSVLATKSYNEAADLGSIAELEVREFFKTPTEGDGIICDMKYSDRVSEIKEQWTSLICRNASARSAVQKEEHKRQIEAQLEHPFFRRFTAQWVYVRACWHAVHALECLREYESAVRLLQLILSTSLVPKRRGKCLNRLTINMFKHLGRLREALGVVRDALDSKEFRLHLGDRQALARRGVAIHKKITAQSQKAVRSAKQLRSEESALDRDPEESGSTPELPDVVTQALKETEEEIVVRKILGKSLNVQAREQQTRKAVMRDKSVDMWRQDVREESIDSVTPVVKSTFSVNGKAWFSSLTSNGATVSVEEYCMEWYTAKEGWVGKHDEGKSIRFLFCLIMWETAMFASVPDVFQTPYQDRPLDLFTEAFFKSRAEAIENRLHEVFSWLPSRVFSEITSQYEEYMGTRAIACDWNSYSVSDLATIGAGLGGPVLSHCFRLLSLDYSYWGGGLPDLTLWKRDDNCQSICHTKLVEVKSARDTLSEVQRAWLLELRKAGASCEVCKVVEKVTSVNAHELELAALGFQSIGALSASRADKE
ncbi:Fanconi-associated nuclease 1-like [Gracilariopsis chorda]|uniref:Fanconi-associated nuclease n=1 Tax=Gracilariopsis chorda TaxID=448386 RepID=A0A2V3IEH1_9FLOR|nr:Fanconi-associated nuclease 1-like [Gracilariopsis chorda]|eukprot:PXF40485.1 Fanconi-associated nuclease 1-like [Gracilariopsis chorda]